MNDLSSSFTAGPSLRKAFTLIEMMMVVGIIGIIATIGIPAVVRSMEKQGMRKAVSDFTEACSHARAAAIFSGQIAELVIRPQDKSFSISGHGSSLSFNATFPEEVHIELLGINFIELQEAEEARVRFYPNGITEEFAMVLRSDNQEVRKITLDVVTALADTEIVQ